MQTKTRVKVVTLAATLVFGMVAAFSLSGATPASAQTLLITLLSIVVTNGPHVITITDNGTDCTITTPVTNCDVDVFGGAVPNASVLLNGVLFTLDLHFAVTSVTTHLPDTNNPNCLFTMSSSKLINLNGSELFLHLLTSLGAYTVTNCGLLIGAAIGLALGASPSGAHTHYHMGTAHG